MANTLRQLKIVQGAEHQKSAQPDPNEVERQLEHAHAQLNQASVSVRESDDDSDKPTPNQEQFRLADITLETTAGATSNAAGGPVPSRLPAQTLAALLVFSEVNRGAWNQLDEPTLQRLGLCELDAIWLVQNYGNGEVISQTHVSAAVDDGVLFVSDSGQALSCNRLAANLSVSDDSHNAVDRVYGYKTSLADHAVLHEQQLSKIGMNEDQAQWCLDNYGDGVAMTHFQLACAVEDGVVSIDDRGKLSDFDLLAKSQALFEIQALSQKEASESTKTTDDFDEAAKKAGVSDSDAQWVKDTFGDANNNIDSVQLADAFTMVLSRGNVRAPVRVKE